MARGGGGGGGSRSSGGGSRSSSRSSGGRSSSSRGGSSYRSNSRSSYGGTHWHNRSYIPYRPYSPRPYRGGAPGGCAPNLGLILFIAFAIILVVFVTMLNTPSITPSTIDREPLDKQYVVTTDYYTDELGWIENPTVLENGMRSFFDKTGVQPYLFITDTVDGQIHPSQDELDAFADRLYDELFEDEGHILLVFHEYNSDSNYSTRYVCGAQAKTVMDQEACNILLDYVDSYYFSDRNDSQMFGDAFRDAGDRIMSKTTPFYIYAIGIGAVVIIVFISFSWWKKAKKQKNLEAQQTERILNADLETIGSKDSTLKDLEDKYK